MSLPLDLYKRKVKRIIQEILERDSFLNELFDTFPFKTDFKFEKSSDEIYSKFQDPQNNKIRAIFHKMGNNCFMLDFTMNGTSYKDSNVKYSLKEYTSLLATIAKVVSQFLEEYKPNALRIDGADSFEKELKGQKGQKMNIYNYFINNMKNNMNYSIQYKANGNFDLIRK